MMQIARRETEDGKRIQELEQENADLQIKVIMRDKRIDVLEGFRRHLHKILDAVLEFEKQGGKLEGDFAGLKNTLVNYEKIPDERKTEN